MPRRQAFTLIELLVVIAIIALLVSILVPSLEKARDMARTTVCSTQERTQGLSFHLYAEDNMGWIPPGAAYRVIDGVSRWPIWPYFLAMANVVPKSDAINPKDTWLITVPAKSNFTCPLAKPNVYGQLEVSYGLNTYMSAYDSYRGVSQGYVSVFGLSSAGSPQYCYNLQKTRRPSEMYLTGDSITRMSSSCYLTYILDSYDTLDFRHNGKKQINMLFHDGHSQRLTRAEVPFEVNYQGVMPWYNQLN